MLKRTAVEGEPARYMWDTCELDLRERAPHVVAPTEKEAVNATASF